MSWEGLLCSLIESSQVDHAESYRALLAIAAVFGLGLVAPAASAAFSSFRGASSDGSKVFFTTTSSWSAATPTAPRRLRALRRDDDPGLPGPDQRQRRLRRRSSSAPRATARRSSSAPTSSWSAATPTAPTDSTSAPGGRRPWSPRARSTATAPSTPSFSGASSDGSKVFLNTDEQLVSGDTDSDADVYERSGGTTTLVSQGQINGNGAFDAFFSGASSDGSKVFFDTDEQLVSGDTDSATGRLRALGGDDDPGLPGPDQRQRRLRRRLRRRLERRHEGVLPPTSSWSAATPTASQDIYERSGGTTTLVSAGPVERQRRLRRRPSTAPPATARGSSSSPTSSWSAATPTAATTSTSAPAGRRPGSPRGQIERQRRLRRGASPAPRATARGSSSRPTEQLVSGDTDSSTGRLRALRRDHDPVSQGQINGNGAIDALRGASSDGSKVFFKTDEQLVSGDTDNSPTSTSAPAGRRPRSHRAQVNGNGAFDADFVGASSDGSKVFFETDEQLVSGDTDGPGRLRALRRGPRHWSRSRP